MKALNIKEVMCSCGNEIRLDYNKAAEVVINQGKENEEKVYQFRCSYCGQTYIDGIPEPIVIDLSFPY